MNSKDIINLIEEEYASCPNIIASNDRLYCYTWYRHEDCVRLMNLLNKITKDNKYTLPNKEQ
jgi:hypothetical protein